jgi:hypothetical protein
LEQSECPAPKLTVTIDELQLQSTSFKKKVKHQTMVIVDVGTDCAHEKAI